MKFNKHERFSIRKFKVGAASVLLGAFGVMLASNAVDIQDINVVKVAKADGSVIISGSAEETEKQQIINELLTKLDVKWKEIEANINDLTTEEQNRARSQKGLLITAINNKINSSTNKENLDSEKRNFISAISDFKDSSAKALVKPNAKNEINTAYVSKKNELQSNKDLLNKLESLKADALSAIQNAKSNDDVSSVKSKYLNEINSLKVLTPEEKKLEEAKKNKIAELINTVELKWKEVEPKRKEYTPKDYERIELIKKNLLTNIRKDIEKVTSNQELINEDNKYSVPVNEFDKYILPKVKPEARKEIEEVYKIKEKELEKSEYLLGRLKTLKKEAEDKILEVDTDIELEDIRDNYKIRINSLDVNNEDKEKLNEKKDKELGRLLFDLEENWKIIDSNDDLRTLEESKDVVDKKIKLKTNLIESIKNAKNEEELLKKVEDYGSVISDLITRLGIEEPKVKPKIIEELKKIYETKKAELKNDYSSISNLKTIIENAILEVKRSNYETDINKVLNDYKEKISEVHISEEYKALDEIEKAASDKIKTVKDAVAISEENKRDVEKELLDILENFKEKVKTAKNIEELVKQAKSDINNVILRLHLETLSNKFNEKVGNPEKLNSNFDIVETLLRQLDIDLKGIYNNKESSFNEGTEFIYLNELRVNDKNNKALVKFLENTMYESVSKVIINVINSNLKDGAHSISIKDILDNLMKENKGYISILKDDYNNFGITTSRVSEEKLESILGLFNKHINAWKSLIPKLDTLNEKVKENKNITEEEAKRILGLIKDEPKNPEASQPEVSKPEETAPIKPAPEKTPVPEKEIPKKPEMAPVPPKVGTPELGDNKQPEVSHPDVNKPGETKPKQPTPEVSPKVPEKEEPKPGKPSGETKPKENTPDKPKASQPDVNKPEETVPNKPTPETTPVPEKEMPKPEKPEASTPEVSKPEKDNSKENNPESSKPGEIKPKENTPNKPEVSNPEVSKPDVNKPEETVPSKPTPEITPNTPDKETPKPGQPEVAPVPPKKDAPKEQGSTSTKQELTKQVGDSVVTVIIEDSRKLDLQAKDVTAENKEFIQSKLNDKSATIKVFDLELLDFNNKSIIKSDKERTVKIVVTENIANKEVSVYYVDKATGQLVKVPAIVNGNTIVFNTNHFSSYGLVISDKEKSKTTSTAKISNKKLPNTGETTNNILGILGLAATVVISTRRKSLKK